MIRTWNLYILEWVKSFAIFWWREIQLDNLRCFWMWRTTQNCEMTNSLNTLWIYVEHLLFTLLKYKYTLMYIKKWLEQKILYILEWVIFYHRTNVLCCKERSLQKKKYSNSKVREKNIAVVFIRLWSLQFEKFLLLPSSLWWQCVCESWLFDTRLSLQIGHSRLGYDGSGPPELLTHPFWQLPSTLPKSHYLFSYIKILGNKSKILESSMSLVKHMMIHLWLFQNHV